MQRSLQKKERSNKQMWGRQKNRQGLISHRYNRLPLLGFPSGGVNRS